MKPIFRATDILIPKKEIDMTKWSVVACDQYTSEPEYWKEVEEEVGTAPSTLRLTLPEVYLGTDDDKRIENINRTMKEYIEKDIFNEIPDTFLYTERTLADGSIRKGLIGAIDLNEYDFNKGSKSAVRATEGTVLSRIPPRVRIRKDAPLELPHIMILIDDREKTVIEPIAEKLTDRTPLYDFSLMERGGTIRGWEIAGGGEIAKGIEKALEVLSSQEHFDSLYGLPDAAPLIFAVGDGNHSLATAKACHEMAKESGIPSDGLALVELVNLHDPSLRFEPIHRLLFGIDPAEVEKSLREYFTDSEITETDDELPEEGSFFFLTEGKKVNLRIAHPTSSLSVGCLGDFLDDYIKRKGCEIDYVHGEETVMSHLSSTVCGFILPRPQKDLLFKTVILDGALPRKTFSMGHANDKRFYLEARKLK